MAISTMRAELAHNFLTLAEKQTAIVPLMIGHRMVGTTMLYTGDLIQGRAHLDQAIALYDPAAHRPLSVRFSQDDRVSSLIRRSQVLWSLGYPQAALADVEHALNEARRLGHFASLAFALWGRYWTWAYCGNHAAAQRFVDELRDLSEEKGALFWKAAGMLEQGRLLVLTGKAAEAVQMLTSAVTAWRSTGATLHLPSYLVALARAYADLGLDDAWRSMYEALTAIETSKERWYAAEIYRIAGQIALLMPEPNAAKAQGYFERALQTARQQQAKSWELREAMSMARLWRDQGKPEQARELLAPVYGWFTEGFDTRDLKEAKALLDTLAA